MTISIEISMYPLVEAYEGPILDFIARMNTYPELSVQTNTMSTQIFGPYAALMAALTKEIKTSFEQELLSIMVLKIINKDLNPAS